jgi:hypothetical protein
MVAVSFPPSEAGELYPLPESCIAKNVITAAGEAAVDPVKVTSGSSLLIKTNLSPSSRSNSEEVTKAVIAVVLAVSLSSEPISWLTRL